MYIDENGYLCNKITTINTDWDMYLRIIKHKVNTETGLFELVND